MSMTAEEQIAVIRARSEGKKIQFKSIAGWVPSSMEFNFSNTEYRVAPTPKPDTIQMVRVYRELDNRFIGFLNSCKPNVKFTFDGETGNLKSVEMI